MMRKILKSYLFAAAICLLLGLTTSCADNATDDGEAVTPHTVIMFLPWAEGLSDDFASNIRSIERRIVADGGMRRTRLFVCVSVSNTQGSLYEITYNPELKQCERKPVETYVWPDEDLRTAMISRFQKVMALSPSSSYSMIIGCHGSGWLPAARSIKKVRALGGLGEANNFSVDDLAEALQVCNMHPRYIAFDACYMANVETAYALRGTCDYMIASTSEILDAGLPYYDIWPELSATLPDYNKVCESFLNSYRYSYGTLSVIDMAEIPKLAEAFREIYAACDCDQMVREGTLRLDDIQPLDGVNAGTTPYNNTVFYDLGSYLSAICTDKVCTAEALSRYRDRLARAVPYSVHTQMIWSNINNHSTYVGLRTFSGLAISDPSQCQSLVLSRISGVAYNVAELKKHTAWWKATH